MDNEWVTNDLSVKEEGQGGKNLPSSHFSYGKFFNDLCPEYLAYGMTYDQYWDGDSDITRAYRKAYVMKKDEMNFSLWLQGLYIYEALISVAPIINPLSKKSEPLPYRERPISLTEAQEEHAREEANKKKLDNGKTFMMNMAMAINNNLSNKEEDNNG